MEITKIPLIMTHPIFFPLFAMAGLTAGVYIWLLFLRLSILFRQKDVLVPMEKKVNAHIRNLFEMPVLFYVVALLYITLDIHFIPAIILAWLYVGFRTLHTGVHCTYNAIPHRAPLFILSTLMLLGLWLTLLVLLSV